MDLRAERIHQRLCRLVQGGLVFCNIMSRTPHNLSVDAIGLAVLVVICYCGETSNVNSDSDHDKDLGYEL